MARRPGRGDGLLDAHLNRLAAALLPYRRGGAAAGPLGRRAGRHRSPAAAGCWSPATGAAPPRPSTSPPNWSASCATTGSRCPRSPCTPRPRALTAIGNDYGYDEVFARQVRAHGRPGDVLLLLSTSGPSANLLAAAHAARDAGLRCWAFTGPAPNPLAEACDEVLAVAVRRTARWCRSCTWSPRTCSASTSTGRCPSRWPPAPCRPSRRPAGRLPSGPVRTGVEVVLDDGPDQQVDA